MIDLGESFYGASHAFSGVASHTLTVRLAGKLQPVPQTTWGIEAETMDVRFELEGRPVGAVEVNTDPVANVYIDYADTPLGVTPLVVGNLDIGSHAGEGWHSASHTVLLRKEGYRKPCPRILPNDATGRVVVISILKQGKAT